ncbi:MAG: heavy metal translocating P-type ATPase [Sphingomonas sp.]
MTAPATLGTAVPAETSSFTIPDLRCAACIAKVESGLAALPGVILARVNFTQKRVRVEHLADVSDGDLRVAIERLGFTAQPFIADQSNPSTDAESRRLARALAVAGFAAMNVMLLSISVWSGAGGVTRDLFHWLSAMIALPAVAYAGRPFFSSAWAALRHGGTNMDVPISIGVLLTCALSLFETATGGAHAYFDGAVMLLFFLLAGRLLDSVMRARAADSVAALMRATPRDATVIAVDGTTQRRDVDELAPAMRILVAAGERIAADGVVESGQSCVDRALVTGESLPEPAGPGTLVLAGTINLDAPLTIRVQAAGATTVIAEIGRLMEAATQSRSRYVRIADRAARLYAPAVHTLALLSLVGWMLAGAGWHQSILIAVAVLIITCPCALGLAVPVSQVVAAGSLMRAGIIVKDGSALERLAKADRVMLDKTGTLTLGRPQVVGEPALSADAAAVAVALAQASRHPLAQALAKWLVAGGVTSANVTDINERPGTGMSGRFEGSDVQLGRPAEMGDAAAADLMAVDYTGPDRKIITIQFDDALRPDAAAALARLAAQGLAPSILSGDRAPVVAHVARLLGIPAQAALRPQDKIALVEDAQRAGHHVLMVGDGLNDGPALKAAYVSMAPSSASNVGQAAADLVFMGDALTPVPVAVAAARRTMRVVRQNFVMAIGYNVIAVPLAILGQVTPLVAALAMSGSSLIVVANALRLRTAAR